MLTCTIELRHPFSTEVKKETLTYSPTRIKTISRIDQSIKKITTAGYDPAYIILGQASYKDVVSYLNFFVKREVVIPDNYKGIPIVVEDTFNYSVKVVPSPKDSLRMKSWVGCEFQRNGLPF